jgi:hypothetical protein
MRPVIGPFPSKPGLWLDFAHQHLGLTLGPTSVPGGPVRVGIHVAKRFFPG